MEQRVEIDANLIGHVLEDLPECAHTQRFMGGDGEVLLPVRHSQIGLTAALVLHHRDHGGSSQGQQFLAHVMKPYQRGRITLLKVAVHGITNLLMQLLQILRFGVNRTANGVGSE